MFYWRRVPTAAGAAADADDDDDDGTVCSWLAVGVFLVSSLGAGPHDY